MTIFLFVIAWLTILMAFLLAKYKNHISVLDGVLNTGVKSVGLRIKAIEDLPHKNSLSPGEFAPLVTRGQRWLYIEKDGNRYAVPQRYVAMGYVNIHGLIIVQKKHYTKILDFSQKYFFELYYASLVGFVVIMLKLLINLIMLGLNRRAASGKQLPFTSLLLVTQEKLDNIVRSVKYSEKTTLNKEYERRLNNALNQQERTLRQTLTGELKISIKKQLSRELERKWVEEYRESVSKEINIQYHGKLSEMETATKRLREEFEKKKTYAKVLGIDLDDNEISNLVKGREFEIYCAKIFDQQPNITIKRWTPDKGIAENIYVESNGDPDFVLEIRWDDEIAYIAVECKFATPWAFKRDENTKNLTWSKWGQYKRYGDFRKREEMEVLILIGVNLPASNPQQLYLAKLYDIKAKDDYYEPYKTNYITLDNVESFKIAKEQLVDNVLGHACCAVVN